MAEDIGTVTHDGVTVTSNQQTTAEMRESLKLPPLGATAVAEPETAPETGTAPPAEPATAPEPKSANPRKNPVARIQQLTAELGNRDQTIQTLNQRLAEIDTLKAEVASLRPRAAVTAPVADTRPTSNDIGTKYASYEDYVDAVSQWHAKQELQAFRAEQAQQATQRASAQAMSDRMQSFTTRLDAVKQAVPDWSPRFEAAIEANGDVPVFPPMWDVLTEADAGPALMLHLAEHPDVVADLFQRSGVTPEMAAAAMAYPNAFGEIVPATVQKQLYRQMSRLEAQVEAAVTPGSTPPARPTTTAHPPISPVSGSHVSPSVGPPDPAQVTQEQWDAYWNGQEREARRAGRR